MLLSFIFYGCKAGNLSPEKVLKAMEDINEYTAEATMKVKNNKSVFTYYMKQYYKKQDKFRVEFFDDGGNTNQIIIYNNNQCGIFHTGIKKPFISENFIGSKEYNSFLNEFLNNYKSDENAYMVLNKMEEREFYVLKCKIEKGNSYFKNAELYVDAKTAMPRQLIIYGDDDSKNIEIKYKNFNYNERIEDSIFEININEIKSA